MFIFNPPLASALPLPRSPLVFTARRGGDGGGVYSDDAPDVAVQVWTDFPHHLWHAVDFRPLPPNSAAQLSLAGSSSPSAEARIDFDDAGLASGGDVGSSGSFSFTYRIVDRRDGSVVRWLGDPHTNGTLRRHDGGSTLFVRESAGWEDDEDDVQPRTRPRAWNGPLPSDVARFGIPNPLRSQSHAHDDQVYAFAVTAHSGLLRFRLVLQQPYFLLEDSGGDNNNDTHIQPLNIPLVALALFPPHDRPVFFSGGDFRIVPCSDNHADGLFTLHTRSRIFLRRHFDADTIRASVRVLPTLLPLDTGTQAFLAVLHSATMRTVTVLPTSISVPSRSVLHLTDLGRIVATPSALYSPASRSTCLLHLEHCIDVLTPPEGGVIVVGTTFQSKNGAFVSVLCPTDAPLRLPSPSALSYSTVDQRSLALRQGLLSLPGLCAVAWFLLTTVLRLLPSIAPVRLALTVSERAEHLLYEYVFGLPRAPGPPAARANGEIVATNGTAPAPHENEVVIDFPTQKLSPLVTLLLRSSADATPAVFCGSEPARVITKKILDKDRSTTLLQVEYPSEKETRPLRVVL